MSCNTSAYIHPGYAFCEFIDSPVSPTTLGDEHESDDISGSPPPPSSSPITHEQPFHCEGETVETTPSPSHHSSLDDSTYSPYLLGPTGTPRAKVNSANNLGHQQMKSRLLNGPLDRPSQIIGVKITDILDIAAAHDYRRHTAPFAQFASLRNSSPSREIQLEKKLMAGPSVPMLTSLAHHRIMCSEQRSSSLIEACPPNRLRASKTLRTAKSLSKVQPTAGDPSEGRFNRRRILPLEYLRASAELEPPMKFARIDHLSGHRSNLPKIRTCFSAKEPASLRRAKSLVSQTSTDRDDEDVVKLLYAPDVVAGPVLPNTVRISQLDSPVCPPTVPITAPPDTPGYLRTKRNHLTRTPTVRVSSKNSPKIPRVPIIAPPPCPGPLIIKCQEDLAEDRIKILLAREREERSSDCLDLLRVPDTRSNRSESESSVSDDDCWADENSPLGPKSVASGDLGTALSADKARRREHWTRALGMDDSFRKEVIGWMLDVLPKIPLKHGIEINDLFDQLDTCPDTRFHAIHLFHRYFLRVAEKQLGIGFSKAESLTETGRGSDDSSMNSPETSWEDSQDGGDDEEAPGSDDTVVEKGEYVSGYETESDDLQDGRRAVTWDIALGSLALCVKLHRDFLAPLSPVYANEFLDLACHSVSYEDLEVSQRDILSAFSFNIGSITPQDFMDELWLALPTLRKATEPLKDGWKSAKLEIWDRLLDAVIEPDFLEFPISLLTASALLDGLIIALARHYKGEVDMKSWPRQGSSWCCCRSTTDHAVKPVPWQVYVLEAMNSVKDIVLDVLDVLQIRDEDLERCRAWMNLVRRE